MSFISHCLSKICLFSQLHSAFDANRSSLDFSARDDYFHRSYFKDRFVLMEYLQQKLLPKYVMGSFSFDVDLLYAFNSFFLILLMCLAKANTGGGLEVSKFVRLWNLSTLQRLNFICNMRKLFQIFDL